MCHVASFWSFSQWLRLPYFDCLFEWKSPEILEFHFLYLFKNAFQLKLQKTGNREAFLIRLGRKFHKSSQLFPFTFVAFLNWFLDEFLEFFRIFSIFDCCKCWSARNLKQLGCTFAQSQIRTYLWKEFLQKRNKQEVRKFQ